FSLQLGAALVAFFLNLSDPLALFLFDGELFYFLAFAQDVVDLGLLVLKGLPDLILELADAPQLLGLGIGVLFNQLAAAIGAPIGFTVLVGPQIGQVFLK